MTIEMRHKEIVDAVIVVACIEFNCTPDDVISDRKTRDLSDARKVITYCLSRQLHYKPETIGEYIRRDRTSVCCIIKKMRSLMQTRDPILKSVEKVESIILRFITKQFTF